MVKLTWISLCFTVSLNVYASENLKRDLELKLPPNMYIAITPAAINDLPINLTLSQAIRKLARVYDSLALMNPREKKLQDRCMDPPWNSDFLDPECEEAKYLGATVSSRKPFLLLAGWAERGLLFETLEKRNYSAANKEEELSESFATNLEAFLLDSEYACRKPLMARYFVDHFTFQPFPHATCEWFNEVKLQANAFGDDNSVKIEPNRVYQIHYLLADKGEAMMSRWGHSMYRVIACSPAREKAGPECLDDIANHYVVSFRANIGDLILSTWKGLTGGYPSQMFLMPMLSVMEEYTALESRDLLSVPLILSEEEKSRFLQNLLTHYWSYEGKYQFATNNCATESRWFLQSSTLSHRDLYRLSANTPTGLLDEFEREGVINRETLKMIRNNKKTARKLGYFFPSQKPLLEKAFSGISLFMPYIHLSDYIEKSSSFERRNYFIRTLQNYSFSNGEARSAFVAKFYLIEKAILANRLSAIQTELIRLSEGDSEFSKSLSKRLKHLLDEGRKLSQTQNPKINDAFIQLMNSLVKDEHFMKINALTDEVKIAQANLVIFQANLSKKLEAFVMPKFTPKN